MIDFVKPHYKDILIILLVIILTISNYHLYKQNNDIKESKVINSEQAKNIEYLENELKLKKQDSEEISKIISEIQTNDNNSNIPPVTNITVTATTPKEVVDDIDNRIKNQDPNLPSEVLEETDRTIISEQPDNEEYKVGVYKINTYRNWYTGTGIGSNNGDTYIPIVIGRQYDKDKSIEFQVNYSFNKNKINGGQVVHLWHFN